MHHPSSLIHYPSAAALLLILLSSCIEHFDAQLPDSQTQLLVVEGTIIGDQDCTFYLSHTFSLNDDDTYLAGHYVSDATVSVKGSDGSIYLGHLTAPGTYQVPVGTLKSDVTYSLQITADGQQYSSEPRYPLTTPDIDSLSYAQPRPDRIVDIMVTPAASADTDQPQYYCWTYDEWWEIRTPYHSMWEYLPDSDTIVITTKRIDRGFHHAPGHQKIIGTNADYQAGQIRDMRLYTRENSALCFEYLYCTRVTQQAISLEEYEYIRLNTQQNEEMGGLFTPQPSQLPTNIHCDSDPRRQAIGFVGVCANVARRDLFIRGAEVGYHMPFDLTIYSFEELDYNSHLELYNAGFRVFNIDLLTTYWVRQYLLDCTVSPWFCTLIQPDFWPNE